MLREERFHLPKTKASCSQETDMRNIWEEIGNKVDDVDHAIDVPWNRTAGIEYRLCLLSNRRSQKVDLGRAVGTGVRPEKSPAKAPRSRGIFFSVARCGPLF